MLDENDGIAPRGPVLSEIRVVIARAAEAVGKQDHRGGLVRWRKVNADRDHAVTAGVTHVEGFRNDRHIRQLERIVGSGFCSERCERGT